MPGEDRKQIILIGTGCGDAGSMTCAARDAIDKADLLIGAPRLLEGRIAETSASRIPAIGAGEILRIIEAADAVRIAVLLSGDTGFYSGARRIYERLQEAPGEAAYDVRVLPGISSVQMLAARLGRPWQDWHLVSAHGTDCDAVTAVMQGRPAFFLTGGTLGPGALCAQLAAAGLEKLPVTIAERLSYPEERLSCGTAGDFAGKTFDSLSVMLADPAASLGDLTPGIPDSAFLRGDVPMTKQIPRAAILSSLQIRSTDTVWDVGAGTGSVAVEMAMRAHRGQVYAVEQSREGVRLMQQNRVRFGVWNLRVQEGRAPEALAALPAPDRVFIGGSEGALTQIIQAVLARNAHARICISAIVLETLQEAVAALTASGLALQVRQIAVTDARPIGKDTVKHMMMAENPIYLITGQKPLSEGKQDV